MNLEIITMWLLMGLTVKPMPLYQQRKQTLHHRWELKLDLPMPEGIHAMGIIWTGLKTEHYKFM